jgi:hypothetical protein
VLSCDDDDLINIEGVCTNCTSLSPSRGRNCYGSCVDIDGKCEVDSHLNVYNENGEGCPHGYMIDKNNSSLCVYDRCSSLFEYECLLNNVEDDADYEDIDYENERKVKEEINEECVIIDGKCDSNQSGYLNVNIETGECPHGYIIDLKSLMKSCIYDCCSAYNNEESCKRNCNSEYVCKFSNEKCSGLYILINSNLDEFYYYY